MECPGDGSGGVCPDEQVDDLFFLIDHFLMQWPADEKCPPDAEDEKDDEGDFGGNGERGLLGDEEGEDSLSEHGDEDKDSGEC